MQKEQTAKDTTGQQDINHPLARSLACPFILSKQSFFLLRNSRGLITSNDRDKKKWCYTSPRVMMAKYLVKASTSVTWTRARPHPTDPKDDI